RLRQRDVEPAEAGHLVPVPVSVMVAVVRARARSRYARRAVAKVRETVEETDLPQGRPAPAVPGVVVAFSGEKPAAHPLRLDAPGKVERAARAGASLLVTGESGSGKEIAAKAFHAAGPKPKGPFVAVNCAAIPSELAERLLFGTKRGAYSDAKEDAEGYVQ